MFDVDSPLIREMIRIARENANYEPTRLHPFLEPVFQGQIRNSPWYLQFISQYNEPPNLTDSNYDYRGAWLHGIKPEVSPDDFRYHWPSFNPTTFRYLKSPEHDTFYKQILTEIGKER